MQTSDGDLVRNCQTMFFSHFHNGFRSVLIYLYIRFIFTQQQPVQHQTILQQIPAGQTVCPMQPTSHTYPQYQPPLTPAPLQPLQISTAPLQQHQVPASQVQPFKWILILFDACILYVICYIENYGRRYSYSIVQRCCIHSLSISSECESPPIFVTRGTTNALYLNIGNIISEVKG